MQYSQKYQAKKSDAVSVSKAVKVESTNSTMSRNLSQCDSFMTPVTTLIM